MRARFALLLIAGLLLAPGLAAAQSATPSAEPATCMPFPICTVPVFTRVVWRTYERTELAFDAPMDLQFGVVEYASAADAHTALPLILLGSTQLFPDYVDTSGVRLTRVEPIGDESLAISGLVVAVNPKYANPYYVTYVMARTGRYIRFGFGWEYAGNPVEAVAAVLSATVDLQPSSAPIVKDASGISHGGLWDAVPSLAQLPQGYQLKEEST